MESIGAEIIFTNLGKLRARKAVNPRLKSRVPVEACRVSLMKHDDDVSIFETVAVAGLAGVHSLFRNRLEAVVVETLAELVEQDVEVVNHGAVDASRGVRELATAHRSPFLIENLVARVVAAGRTTDHFELHRETQRDLDSELVLGWPSAATNFFGRDLHGEKPPNALFCIIA